MKIENIFEWQALAFERAIDLYRAKYPSQREFMFTFEGICVESTFTIVIFSETKTMEFDKQIVLFSEMEMGGQDWHEYISAQINVADWKEALNNKE